MQIKIDGEVLEVDKVLAYADLPMLQCGKLEYYVAKDSESAGEAARKYWEDMANDDPKELACIIGDETLIKWGLNQWAGPGSTSVRNLEEWLDLWLDTPEEQWASYDGVERDVEEIEELYEDEEVELSVLEADPSTSDVERHNELLAKATMFIEWQELIDELGFTPTVAYRHN